MKPKYVDYKCADCGAPISITWKSYKRILSHNDVHDTPHYCKKCLSTRYSERVKAEWKSKSDNDKKEKINQLTTASRNRWNIISESERKVISNKAKDQWNNKTNEEKNETLNKMNKGYRIWFDNLSSDTKNKMIQIRSLAWEKWWTSLSKEDQELIVDRMQNGYHEYLIILI